MIAGMFPGIVTDARKPTIVAGLPSLNDAMRAARIDTPRRIAAFLTTLRFESWITYNAKQSDGRPFTGRGFIQLTGQPNYQAAGDYLHADFVANPEWVRNLTYSARVATWYWTVARPGCNVAADHDDMGAINKAIGYPVVTFADGSTNDQARCNGYAAALKYLTGEIVTPKCTR